MQVEEVNFSQWKKSRSTIPTQCDGKIEMLHGSKSRFEYMVWWLLLLVDCEVGRH